MKKILFAISLLLCAVPAFADSRADGVLSKLAAKITSLGNYNAAFSVEAEGNRLKGVYAVSGGKYYMRTAEYEVVCDGKTRWEINHGDEEVLVDNSNPDDRSILSNPTRAFEFAADIFRSAYKGEQTIGGDVCDVVELTPIDTKSPLLCVTVKVSRRTGLPVELRYLSDGLSEDVVVSIDKLEAGLIVGASFTFDRQKYKEYDIIDFR